ncbi:MAG: hypothetical protein ACK5M7_14025 [Draconibacterium sp.]
MNRSGWTKKDLTDKRHQVFKGYRVKLEKSSRKEIDQQFIVPWEMRRDEYNIVIH